MLGFEDTKAAGLNAVLLDQLFPHGREETVDHVAGGEFRDAGRSSHLVSQICLRDRRQWCLPRRDVSA